jgi:chromosome segregation ATPase
LRLVEGQSSERAKTIELQEKEILSLRGKVVENEELVQRAMGMEGFMDQQMALLRQEHEEAIRQLKNQHSKEMEVEEERHHEELTQAQLCLLSPSLPHNPLATQEVEILKKEKEVLAQQRDNLQQKMQLVTSELEESAKSLVAFDERLSAKDEKIARLKDEIKSLYLSLNNVTESNQALKSKSKSMKRLLSSDSSSGTGGSSGGSDGPLLVSTPPPSKPLFTNPLMDKHWGLFYLATFGLLLVIHHMFSSYYFSHGSHQ